MCPLYIQTSLARVAHTQIFDLLMYSWASRGLYEKERRMQGFREWQHQKRREKLLTMF